MSSSSAQEWTQTEEGHDYIADILLRRPSTPSDPETWPELNEWMANALETMHALFRPIVRDLNAEEYVPDLPTDDGDGQPVPDGDDGQ